MEDSSKTISQLCPIIRLAASASPPDLSAIETAARELHAVLDKGCSISRKLVGEVVSVARSIITISMDPVISLTSSSAENLVAIRLEFYHCLNLIISGDSSDEDHGSPLKPLLSPCFVTTLANDLSPTSTPVPPTQASESPTSNVCVSPLSRAALLLLGTLTCISDGEDSSSSKMGPCELMQPLLLSMLQSLALAALAEADAQAQALRAVRETPEMGTRATTDMAAEAAAAEAAATAEAETETQTGRLSKGPPEGPWPTLNAVLWVWHNLVAETSPPLATRFAHCDAVGGVLRAAAAAAATTLSSTATATAVATAAAAGSRDETASAAAASEVWKAARWSLQIAELLVDKRFVDPNFYSRLRDSGPPGASRGWDWDEAALRAYVCHAGFFDIAAVCARAEELAAAAAQESATKNDEDNGDRDSTDQDKDKDEVDDGYCSLWASGQDSQPPPSDVNGGIAQILNNLSKIFSQPLVPTASRKKGRKRAVADSDSATPASAAADKAEESWKTRLQRAVAASVIDAGAGNAEWVHNGKGKVARALLRAMGGKKCSENVLEATT